MRGGGHPDVTGRRCRSRKWAGKGYKSPPPSAPLHRGPREARRELGGRSSRLLPGSGGGSERAPGLERSGQRAPGGEDYPGKRRLLAGASEWGSRGAGQERKRTTQAARPTAARSAGTRRAGRIALTMVSCWDTGVLLYALLGCLLLPEPSSGAKLKSPELNLKGTQHVLQVGQTLRLQCRSGAAHSWSLPESLSMENERLRITKSSCGRNGKLFCSTLTVNSAHINDTGFYSCRHLPGSTSKEKQPDPTIYIYVRDIGKPFIEMFPETPKVIQMVEGEKLIIPCRVSSPDLTVTLKKVPFDAIISDGKRIIWDSRKGFVIPHATYREIGFLSCETRSNGTVFVSNYLTHRIDNKIISIQVGPGNPVKLLSNHTLTLNCTVMTALNTRVQIIWDYPHKVDNRASIKQRFYRSDTFTNMFYSVLTIAKAKKTDKGFYTCQAQSGPSFKSANISVNVFEKAFITVKHRESHVYEATAGQQSYQLSLKVKAFPPPEVVWFDFCSSHEESYLLDANSNIGNRIESITQRIVTTEGKNKIASSLVVADSRDSGIYGCLASNKIGTEERNITFYVTDVPNGFRVNLEKMPAEGEDLKLSCTVNKFLYRDITWILLRTVNNKTIYHSIRKQKMAVTGKHSTTLNLIIKNVSLEDSGTYACRARNVYTGEERLQKTEVTIRGQEAPHLLQNLSDHTVAISGSTTLDCHAGGVPEPQITWFKNHHEIQQEPGIILGPGNSTLFIERVTEEDEGVYQCRATNPKGAVESSAYLTVQGTSDKSNLELITLTCTCVAATLFWLLLTLFIRKLKRSSSEIKTDYLSIIMDPDEVPLDEQCERLPYDASKWEFARERLKLGKSLGRGAFGKVVQASAFGIKKSPTCRTVAVKMLKEGATANEYKALMTELKILTHIGHHLNVVNLLGACTKQGGPLMVIVEYCKYGNLSNYLKSKRDLFFLNKDAALHTEPKKETPEPGLEPDEKPRLDSVTSSESFASSGFQEDKSLSDVEEEEDSDDFYKQPITMEDLISYSFQVARGMEFLSSRKCIHRDLAARNILLSENNVVKICDFGLARDIYKNPDYVRKGDTRLPLKWMAPESIFDKIYSTKSDVWSYGVLLWEIFSLGGSPYPGVQMDEDFCSRLKEGMRMRAPEYATSEIYQIMLDCWHKDPKERPRFAELVEKLGDLLQANVQQDGKDYIPLNAILTGNSGFAYSTPAFSEDFFKDGISAPKFNSGSSDDVRYVNAFKFMSLERIKTFEELSPNTASVFDDYQLDSSTLVASPLLKRFTWTASKPKASLMLDLHVTSKSKESGLSHTTRPSFCFSSCGHIRSVHDNLELGKEDSCCSPPPDYNSVVLYSTPPA
ncbi:vascular endothelial growth factor receptor 1 isoform X2 [Octodon degus]|uniref:Vascular endothelial growth factor receptor 1 n=1 Tax=Octodon degus TaxID=10160 RepID=A0A6P6EEW1_OCTDE|nr:vascular endothelial growth factor receptor 1 isoform X2 [Octodon degus]